MIRSMARRASAAAPCLRALAAGLALVLAGCAASEPQHSPGVCTFATRGGVGLLCCPNPSGRQTCFLSHGGIEI